MKARSPVPIDRSTHRAETFDSGVEALDRWLRKSAGQAERRRAARTYVACSPANVILGYVTLTAGQVATSDAADHVARGMSRHFPIPVAIIARLAVDRSAQGSGIGLGLLDFALGRCLDAGAAVGIRAVVVDALDQRAAGFYRQFGFDAVPDAPLRLMAPVDDLRAGLTD